MNIALPRRHLLGAAALGLSLSLLSAAGPARAATPIAQEGFRRIGGIEQWVTAHGQDSSKPVLLFLHGGPGNPLNPFAQTIYGAWSRDFVLVQWDQRGAGTNTLSRTADYVASKCGQQISVTFVNNIDRFGCRSVKKCSGSSELSAGCITWLDSYTSGLSVGGALASEGSMGQSSVMLSPAPG